MSFINVNVNDADVLTELCIRLIQRNYCIITLHIWSCKLWAYQSKRCVKSMNNLSFKQQELLSSNAQFQMVVFFLLCYRFQRHITYRMSKEIRSLSIFCFFIVLKFPSGESKWFRFNANGLWLIIICWLAISLTYRIHGFYWIFIDGYSLHCPMCTLSIWLKFKVEKWTIAKQTKFNQFPELYSYWNLNCIPNQIFLLHL